MKVKRHRLYSDDDQEVRFEQSPNYRGDIVSHDYIVMHYTAGTSAEGSISWLTNRRAGASAHLVIGRDGSIAQLVPFNKRAWHAGSSTWNNRIGLNSYSIGIELDNAGRLTQRGGEWEHWSGQRINSDDVVVATHKYESTPAGWHSYTQAQLESALSVTEALVEHYGIKDIVGHDDIAPNRKTDPGPAFPMESFRSHVMGRNADEEDVLRVTTNLNIRSGPGTQHAKLIDSTLPAGTRVVVYQHQGNWRFVYVVDEVDGVSDLEGWVHGAYLADD